jgi:hypothetical protein
VRQTEEAALTGSGGQKTDHAIASKGSLTRVNHYREATRRLLRADLYRDDRARALDRLYQRAKAEPFGDVAVRAIVAEIGWGQDRVDVVDDLALFATIDKEVGAHRSLRAQGFERCPRCKSTLSTEIDWRRWLGERNGLSNEFEAREGAVPRVG